MLFSVTQASIVTSATACAALAPVRHNKADASCNLWLSDRLSIEKAPNKPKEQREVSQKEFFLSVI